MYILVTYDVATSTEGGTKRLRHVAKICLDYGQRVQNSVFECQLDPGQLVQMKTRLLKAIDDSADSLRFYHLPNNWQPRVEHVGTKKPYDPSGPLIV